MTSTGTLYADAFVSVLAGISLFGLRWGVSKTGVTGRMRRMFSFAAGVLGVFYLLRVPAWLTEADLADRAVIATAALIPLAMTLVAETAVGRHAPRWIKLMMAVGTPAFILGALVLPSSTGRIYLPLLLVFQVATFIGLARLLWSQGLDLTLAQRRLARTFGLVMLAASPLVITDFSFTNAGFPLHLSALVILVGVWLIVSASSWTVRPTIALAALGCFAALATLGGFTVALSAGANPVTATAFLLALLIFAAIIGEALRLKAGTLAGRLTEFLVIPPRDNQESDLLIRLAGLDPITLDSAELSEFDETALTRTFGTRPLWTPDGTTDEDTTEQLTEILRRTTSTHILATDIAPLRLVALQLSPAEANAQVEGLLAAAAWRLRTKATP
ncbi:hypothetical protein AADZ90_005945 [Aestuariibius sp. 2305UL40-4]|uniref:hypothetical protein n=1 Tax=Aestuariibius violaceus TaxID=3234132 RepID=UPI00345EF2F5